MTSFGFVIILCHWSRLPQKLNTCLDDIYPKDHQTSPKYHQCSAPQNLPPNKSGGWAKSAKIGLKKERWPRCYHRKWIRFFAVGKIISDGLCRQICVIDFHRLGLQLICDHAIWPSEAKRVGWSPSCIFPRSAIISSTLNFTRVIWGADRRSVKFIW